MDPQKIRDIKNVVAGSLLLLHEGERTPIQVLVIHTPIMVDDYHYIIPISPMEKEQPGGLFEECLLDAVWWLDSRNYGIQSPKRARYFLEETFSLLSQEELLKALRPLKDKIRLPERFASLEAYPGAQVQIRNLVVFVELID